METYQSVENERNILRQRVKMLEDVLRDIEWIEAEVVEKELEELKVAVVDACNSIICLCGEGPEVIRSSDIYSAVIKEAVKLERLCRGGK